MIDTFHQMSLVPKEKQRLQKMEILKQEQIEKEKLRLLLFENLKNYCLVEINKSLLKGESVIQIFCNKDIDCLSTEEEENLIEYYKKLFRDAKYHNAFIRFNHIHKILFIISVVCCHHKCNSTMTI